MECTSKLRIVYGDYTLGVHGEGFDYIFSYSQGGLESVVKNGYEWLYRCPKPTFWRALTDNDRGSKFHIKSGSWLAADMFIDCKEIEVITDGKSQGKPCAPDNNKYGGDVLAENIVVKFVYETVTNPRTTVDVIYSVENTGKITVSVSYKGVKGLPQLPVFGLRFIMPTLADKYMYEGISGETYPDRMAGVKGVYEINDLSLTPYLVPQECGMRMGTDWLEVTRHTSLNNSRKDNSAQILRIEKKEDTFAFSCLPYTASEIENATHHEELPPARRTVLCIYGAVRGVGGIDSWGSDVEDAYHIDAEKDITYSFVIC